ncbi:dihydroorotate dehydrogenase electron transfer subunit [Candidatus Methylomirabilis sp.]|uniref:dihydroorotate dehydrogenase electron transfer subunit n=1 Tax=Candidatus Methylomirabilis sp. TaxID=2032687 RepID=UPI002A614458|nr:dihydroorotate dehydrogenase electron transfer subunit [Candidatus Methylomirabilis sp.]
MAAASEVQVEVVANRQIAPEYFSMRLVGPRHLARFRPGQFLMLGWPDGRDPLLPRPMSIRCASQFKVQGVKFQVQKGSFANPKLGTAQVEILYKVCGRGTTLLAAMRPGRSLRVLGPLGNGFEVPRSVTDIFLIAGGIGAPPIAALAEALAARRTSRGTKMTVFLGGRSKADLLCTADFRRAGAKIHVTTEDGSAGQKGLVTELLEQYLHTRHPTPDTSIYACGPYPMLAALASLAEKYELPYQASLEASMACGFGACMGCVVPVKGGGQDRTYRLVCKDGPVFDARDILWSHQR